MQASSSQTTSKYFSSLLTRVYITTLSGIALLVVCGQLTVVQGLNKRYGDGQLINIACKQSTLSERLGKCVLAIEQSKDRSEIQKYAKEMRAAIHELSQNHENLHFGSSDLQRTDVPTEILPEIDSANEASYDSLITAARATVASLEEVNFEPGRASGIGTYASQILQAQSKYEAGISQMSTVLQTTSENRIDELENTGLSLVLATVLSLLLIALVIFRPAVNQLSAAIVLLEHAQGKMRTNEARLSAILNSMAEGVIVVDRDGTCLLVNEAARYIHSLPPESELEAHDIHFLKLYNFFEPDAVTPIAPNELPLRKVLAGTSMDRMEIYLQPIDTTQPGFWVLGTTRPLRDEKNNLVGGLVVIQDVTERKLSARRFSKFYSASAQELQAPLMAIRDALRAIDLKAEDLDVRTHEKICRGQIETERLVQLVNEILDVKRLEDGSLQLDYEQFDVQPVLTEAIEHARSFCKRTKVTVQTSIDCHSVEADKLRLQLVMQNLIANALTVSNDGEIIEVVARERDQNLRVAIVDRGAKYARSKSPESSGSAGINESSKNNESGEETECSPEHREGRSGIALAISKRIIEMHDGRMGFDGDANKGSTFWFEVPIVKAQAKISRRSSPESSAAEKV